MYPTSTSSSRRPTNAGGVAPRRRLRLCRPPHPFPNAAAPAPAAAASSGGRNLKAAVGIYPTLNAQHTKANAGGVAPVVSGFAAPRSVAAAAPAPAAKAAASSSGRKLSGAFVAGFWSRTSKPAGSSSSTAVKAASTTANTNNNRKARAGRKLEAAVGIYPTLNAQKAAIASKSAAAAGGAAPVAVSGFAAPRTVPAPAPAPAAKH